MAIPLDEAGLRNIKDFYLMYNQISELCFNRCTVNFNSRSLTDEEAACTDVCVAKHVQYNNKTMAVYMVEQPKALERKLAEAEKEAAATVARMKEQGIDTDSLSPQESRPEIKFTLYSLTRRRHFQLRYNGYLMFLGSSFTTTSASFRNNF